MSTAVVVSGIVAAVENAGAAVAPQASEILTVLKGLYDLIGNAVADFETRMAAADAQQGVGLVAQEDSDAAGIKARLATSKPPVAAVALPQPAAPVVPVPVVSVVGSPAPLA